MPHMIMAHEVDPKADLINKIGSLDDMDVLHNQVLVAVYMRPKVTKSGIHLTDAYRDEDTSQGKVGIIVKVGPVAFADPDGRWSWPGDMGVGDWVFFRASDGWNTTVNGVLCRMLDDVRVRGRIQHPDQVW